MSLGFKRLTDRCGNYVLKFGRCIDELKCTCRAFNLYPILSTVHCRID